ncbi:MAG TPA: hypothetical protein VHT75_18890 [Acidimicrobiales bacterium]|jgi:predicted metal-dependent enzyme (double-stranded beta helix superfamily)|nr:hypothetical protein [Acidimicrobiales bacterium]
MTETTTPALRHLAERTAAILDEHATATATATGGGAAPGQIAAVLREVLDDAELLPESLRRYRPPAGFATFLHARRSAFVVFSTITAPTRPVPIHDHGSWGLVGLVHGREEEIRYRLDGGSLHECGRSPYSAGQVMVVPPPPDDIHQVFNLGDAHSVAVHLFLKDPIPSGFQIFLAPDFRACPTGPLAYDPLPVAVA